MAKGKSGRIVLEVDPTLKRKLYLILEEDQTTLKDWFVQTASTFVSQRSKPQQGHTLIVAENKENYRPGNE